MKRPSPFATAPADCPRVALAIAAHPDDIEFLMAGTLLLLKSRGWEIHYFNLSGGDCGSTRWNASKTRAVRLREAKASARLLGAKFHPPLTRDLQIVYAVPLLRRIAAVVRAVNPGILLTHSPQDYMEDHMATARLAVTAAFARGMRNFATTPRRAPVGSSVTIYHALPHGLRDGLGSKIQPDFLVNTTPFHGLKRRALALHRSQREWLDASQGMDCYLSSMDALSREAGRMSRRFTHAEGWRRHSHLGFCDAEADPLRAALSTARVSSRGTRCG